MQEKLESTTRELVSLQKETPIQLHAASLSLNILFSMFPLLLMIVSVFGVMGANETRMTAMLKTLHAIIPADTLASTQDIFVGFSVNKSIGVFSIGFLLLLWSASRVMRSAVQSLNRIYKNRNTRRWYSHAVIATISVVVIGVVLFVASNLAIWGDILMHRLAETTELPSALDLMLINVHWPIMFITLTVLLACMYRYIPSHEKATSIEQHLLGAAIATAIWLASGVLFNLYLSHTDRFHIYGAIGTIIILLLYIQTCSYAFLFGAYINSARHEDTERKGWIRRIRKSISWHGSA